MKTEGSYQEELGLHMLHVADPTLPIGGFSHSNGLETYVQQQGVHDAATAALFVSQMLQYNYKYNDGLFVRLAHENTSQKDRDALLALDQKCHAAKAPRETREGNQKLGARFLKLYAHLVDDPFLDAYGSAVSKKEARGQYAVAYGLVTQLLGISKPQALSSFYYNAATAMVTNAVKLVPLGQLEGQKILFGLMPLIRDLVTETLELDEGMLAVCNPAFDIKCMQHERLYSRLYMS